MKELSVQEIIALMEALGKNKLGSLKIKDKDFSLELKDREAPQVITSPGPSPTAPPASPEAPHLPAGPEEPSHTGRAVASPIVGTFYAAPAPDKDPYVRVGSKVKKGDVLFIIESMKLMNEVTSELDGTVCEIVAENGQGVEYGQPILYID